jgi:hypothetical protein
MVEDERIRWCPRTFDQVRAGMPVRSVSLPGRTHSTRYPTKNAVDDVRSLRALFHPMSSRWVGLLDVEARRRTSPITFSIPRSDQRASLQVGALVKLIFEADPPSATGLTAERMWVEMREVRDGRFVGALDNEPSFIVDLEPGDAVHFGPEHVAAIYDSPSGLQIPFAKFALVTRDVFEDRRFPVEAYRVEPTAEDSSGWTLIGPEGDAGDTGDLRRVLVGDLIEWFRTLDSILDEPVGTRWTWNPERLEYERR